MKSKRADQWAETSKKFTCDIKKRVASRAVRPAVALALVAGEPMKTGALRGFKDSLALGPRPRCVQGSGLTPQQGQELGAGSGPVLAHGSLPGPSLSSRSPFSSVACCLVPQVPTAFFPLGLLAQVYTLLKN